MVRNSHKEDQSEWIGLLCGNGYLEDGFEPIAVQHPGGVLLTPVHKLVATLIFAAGKNAYRIPIPHQKS